MLLDVCNTILIQDCMERYDVIQYKNGWCKMTYKGYDTLWYDTVNTIYAMSDLIKYALI